MKKMLNFLAVVAMASAVWPDIVNGSFSGGAAGRIANLRSFSVMGKGWYMNNRLTQQFKFIDGTATLDGAEVSSDPVAIGQLFVYGETGDRLLNFDVTVLDTNGDINFRVQLYGYKQRTAEKTILYDNAIKLESSDPPVTTSNYEIKELVNYSYRKGGTTGVTQRVKFAASTEYVFYGIRITAVRLDHSDKITLDNVSITTVPEPQPANVP